MEAKVNALHMGKQTKQEATGFFPVLIGHFGPERFGRESDLYWEKQLKLLKEYL